MLESPRPLESDVQPGTRRGALLSPISKIARHEIVNSPSRPAATVSDRQFSGVSHRPVGIFGTLGPGVWRRRFVSARSPFVPARQSSRSDRIGIGQEQPQFHQAIRLSFHAGRAGQRAAHERGIVLAATAAAGGRRVSGRKDRRLWSRHGIGSGAYVGQLARRRIARHPCRHDASYPRHRGPHAVRRRCYRAIARYRRVAAAGDTQFWNELQPANSAAELDSDQRKSQSAGRGALTESRRTTNHRTAPRRE